MATDELTRPLGLDRGRRGRRWIPFAAIVAPPLALGLAIGGYLLLRPQNPDLPAGAVVAAIDGKPTGSVAPPVPAPESPPVDAGVPALTEVSPSGGLEEIGGGEVVITDPSRPQAVVLAAAPRADLVESGKYGPMPRIGDDGTRPLDAYARPVEVQRGFFPVAIIIGGIGVEGEGSDAAIASLPGEVTLAIAPYGDDLPRTVAAARGAGHEVLLQLPLEPYNYPDIDPGPKTLTTGASTGENLDRLHWLLARITTYVGVMNYMGARFTAEDKALVPVIDEIGARGLLYVDDGSSARSRAGTVANGKAPVVRADVVLDADTTPAAIDARLDQLVAIARERGFAIATGTAFPVTVDRIAAFAEKAAKRGVVLVPVSALAEARRS